MTAWIAGDDRHRPPLRIRRLYDRNGDLWVRDTARSHVWTPDLFGYAVKWSSEAMFELSPFTEHPRSTR